MGPLIQNQRKGCTSRWCFFGAICMCSSIKGGKAVLVVSCLTFCSQFLAPKENANADTAAAFEEGGDVDDLVSTFNVYQVLSRLNLPEL